MIKNKYRAWDGKKMFYDGDLYHPNYSNLAKWELKERVYPCKITNHGILVCNKLSNKQLNDYVELTKNGKHCTYYSDWESERLYNENITLLEYTGLKDKHGIEIYEGDIIRVSEEYGGSAYIPLVVDFKDGCFVLRPINNLSAYNPIFEYDFSQVNEIIGNKFDNPELMIF